MARKSVRLFKEGRNYGAYFYDGLSKVFWDDLSAQDQHDLLMAMATAFKIFSKNVKKL